MKTHSTVKSAKITAISIFALMFVSSFIFIFFPQMELEVASTIYGVGYLLIGGARLFGYWSNDLYRLAFQNGLAAGGFCIILGLITLFISDKMLVILPLLLVVFVILDSMLKLQVAIEAKEFGMHGWLALVLVACGLCIFGLIAFVRGLDGSDPNRGMVFAGIAFAADSAASIFDTTYTVRLKAKKYNIEENVE